MADWKVRLFGALRVTGYDHRPVRFRTRGAEAVFAYLALHAGEAVRRETLMDVGWPGQPDSSARQNLRTTLSSLRSTFGTQSIEADRQVVSLAEDYFDIDVISLRSGSDISVYQGRFLEGLDGEWVLAHSAQLEDLYFQRVLELIEELPESDALRLASEALARNPSRLDLRLRLRELGAQPEPLSAPAASTPFVGREAELDSIERLFQTARWVTLTGPGGSGKTRIAAEFHRRALPDSWYVSLVDCREATQVGDAIRRALRIPSSISRTSMEQVAFALTESHGTLVLDNLEQIVEVASELETLLTLCPELRLLTTSQVPLGSANEVEFPVGPLDVQGASVELFLNRARLMNRVDVPTSNLETIQRICEALEGYPLAIELAAAKSRVLDVRAILSQLDDRLGFLSDTSKGGRRHSLRAALDWSFECLAAREQDLLLALCAFRGTFSVEAVVAVCSPENAVGSLDRLLASAWITAVDTPVGTRFRLLETMREFAEELVSPSRLRILRERHAQYFMGLAERCINATFTSAELSVFAEVDVDISNLDQAWEWLREHHQDRALDFVRYLNWYWILRGNLRDAEHRMAEAILGAKTVPSAELGHAFQCYGNFLLFQGRLNEAKPWFLRAHHTCVEAGDPVFTGLSLCQVAQIHAEYGKYDQAIVEAERSLPYLFEDGNPNWIGAGYVICCLVSNRMADLMKGQEYGELAVQFCREGGYPWGLASALNELAMTRHLAGRFDEALTLQHESIELKRLGDAPRSMALSLVDLAATHFELGNDDESARTLREGFTQLRRIQAENMFPVAYLTAGRILFLRGDVDAASSCLSYGKRLASVTSTSHAHLQAGLDLLTRMQISQVPDLDPVVLVRNL